MRIRPFQPAAAGALLLAAPLLCQANTVPGLDTRLTQIECPTYFGRRGASYPNGEIAIAYSYYMCNSGTVVVPWLEASHGPAPMATAHPRFAFSVVRESNGRIEQITDKRTYVKHASGAANQSGACGTCQSPGTSTAVGIHCSDAYGANTNGDRYSLGPADEIDPWLNTWNPIGSYFDRGDPDVGLPNNHDGVRSLTSGNFADPVANRVTLHEADLQASGRYFYCMDMLVEGEDADLRADNFGYREMVPMHSGSTWAFADGPVLFTNGTVLDRWNGATVSSARNGESDGSFFVAVRVTEPTAGFYHYEYVVQDFDNARGAAALRIPVAPRAAVSAIGFRDVDDDPLDSWTWSRSGDQLVFQAPANNPLDWNQMFNFWFDCSAAPQSGSVALDQARPGAGALAVAVQVPVPGAAAEVFQIDPGCGTPEPTLTAIGLPTLGNPSFALATGVAPGASVLLFRAFAPSNTLLAPGCWQFLDSATLVVHGFYVADGAGRVTAPVPVPADQTLEGLRVYWQSVEFAAGGPLFGAFAASNGLMTLLGSH